MDLLLVSLASLFAGFVDSIVGGGGLILTPMLFAVFPATHPATLFGVNKSASIWGTAAAATQYAQRVVQPVGVRAIDFFQCITRTIDQRAGRQQYCRGLFAGQCGAAPLSHLVFKLRRGGDGDQDGANRRILCQ